jgi:hypothetical protein
MNGNENELRVRFGHKDSAGMLQKVNKSFKGISKLQKLTFISIVLIVMAAGCQTFKDHWDHQFNDDREDDMSGEWFGSHNGPERGDTTYYRIFLQVRDSTGVVIYSKDIQSFGDTLLSRYFLDEGLYTLSIYSNWYHAMPVHKIIAGTDRWEYHINFGSKETGEVKKEIELRSQAEYLKFGITDF